MSKANSVPNFAAKMCPANTKPLASAVVKCWGGLSHLNGFAGLVGSVLLEPLLAGSAGTALAVGVNR